MGKKGLFFIVIGLLTLVMVACRGNDSVAIPNYEVAQEISYVRDGAYCVIYMVAVDAGIDEDELRLVYYDLINNDGYLYHVLWFYDSLEAANSESMYNVGLLAEPGASKEPVYFRAWDVVNRDEPSVKELQEIFPEAMLTEGQLKDMILRMYKGDIVDAENPDKQPVETFSKTIDSKQYNLDVFEDGSYVFIGSYIPLQ